MIHARTMMKMTERSRGYQTGGGPMKNMNALLRHLRCLGKIGTSCIST